MNLYYDCLDVVACSLSTLPGSTFSWNRNDSNCLIEWEPTTEANATTIHRECQNNSGWPCSPWEPEAAGVMSCWTTCCVTNQTNFTRKIHKIPNCPVRRGVDMRLTRIGALFDVKWFLPYTDDGRKIIIIKREIRIPNFVFLSSTKRGSRTTTLSAAFCSSSSIRVLVLCFYFFFFFSLRFALFFGTPIRSSSSSNNWINISNHRNFTIDR